jgi:diguanylate cyclase (GGDEF)-like protein
MTIVWAVHVTQAGGVEAGMALTRSVLAKFRARPDTITLSIILISVILFPACLLPQHLFPRTAAPGFLIVMVFLLGAAHWGPAMDLFTGYNVFPRRGGLVMAYACAGTGIISIVSLLLLVGIIGDRTTPYLTRDPGALVFLLVRCWFFAATALLLWYSRRNRTPSTWRDVAGYGSVFSVVTLVVCAAMIPGGVSSVFARLTGISGSVAAVVAAVAAVLGATVLFPRNQKQVLLSRGVCFAGVALSCGALLQVTHEAYTTAWYGAQVLVFDSALILQITVSLLDTWLYRKSARAGEALAVANVTERTQNERLTTFWEVFTNVKLSGQARLTACLEFGARGVRPAMHFTGVAAHIEEGELIVDAAFGEQAEVLQPGVLISFADSGMADIAANDRPVFACDDTQRAGIWDRRAAIRRFGVRSIIGGRYYFGGKVYLVAFGAREPATPSFTESDMAYVEVLMSAFLARQTHEAQLEYLRYSAANDSLTDLPNRGQFRIAFMRAQQESQNNALFIVDLDRFREVNETMGHQAGDAILVEVAAALRAELHPGESVARLGGDNFGVLMTNVASPSSAAQRAEQFCGIFERQFSLGDRDGRESARVTASIGVALSPRDGTTFEDVLAHADSAVDVAKRRGRHRVALFQPETQGSIIDRRAMRTALTSAIREDRLLLHYQPIISLATSRVVGAEALVRWNDPERGLVPPEQFIPFAEASGMIAEIGNWVMEQALRDAPAFVRIIDNFRLYFNLSAKQIDDQDFIDRFRAMLKRQPELEGHIGVELTESTIVGDIEHSLRTITNLRSLGVRVALDDFGTGYSSLARLKRFPFDVIKIDRTFLAGVPDDPQDVAIVDTLLTIARRFGYTAVAEGVEEPDQLVWLHKRGCGMAQGFAIARPMPLPECTAWLSANRVVDVHGRQHLASVTHVEELSVREPRTTGAGTQT